MTSPFFYFGCVPAVETMQDEWKQVSVGDEFTCGIKGDGSLLCWGINEPGLSSPENDDPCCDYGQVRDAPKTGLFAQVTAGNLHVCAILEEGGESNVLCWGRDLEDQTVTPKNTMSKISAGGWFNCGIGKEDNSILCWGSDYHGLISETPAGTRFESVDCGKTFACAIDEDSEISCWGYDGDSGGDGRTYPPAGLYKQISAGYQHACAIAQDDTLVCWGNDSVGQASPTDGYYIDVSAGFGCSCAITTAGRVDCWGSDLWAETNVPSTASFRQVSVGMFHSCGITTEGELICWGSDYYGQSTPP